MSRLPASYAGEPSNSFNTGAQYFWHPHEYQPLPPNREPTQPLVVIQCVTVAELIDGQVVHCGYRTNVLGVGGLGLPYFTRTYEFDVAGDGVVPGNIAVDVSLLATAAEVATALLAAMQAQMAAGPVRAYANPADATQVIVRSLAHGITLAASENVVDADFTVTTLAKYVQCANLAAGPARLHMAYDRTPNAGSPAQNQEAY